MTVTVRLEIVRVIQIVQYAVTVHVEHCGRAERSNIRGRSEQQWRAVGEKDLRKVVNACVVAVDLEVLHHNVPRGVDALVANQDFGLAILIYVDGTRPLPVRSIALAKRAPAPDLDLFEREAIAGGMTEIEVTRWVAVLGISQI